jgi:superfamily II DNA or RNA helicase
MSGKPRRLRPYQSQAVKAWHRDVERGKTRSAVVLPTGTGKSTVGAGVVVPWAQERGPGSVLAVAHRDELLTQLTSTFSDLDPLLPVGRWQASRKDAGRPITVASIQTLWQAGGWEKYERANGRPGMILYDECHHAVSPSSVSVLNAAGAMHGHSPTPLLGLTATMVRGDRIGLGDVWQSVAFQRDIGWAIREGFLVVPRGKVIVVKSLHLDDAKVSGGDYQEGELGSMIEQGADEIVDAWVKHAEGRITASFAPTVEAAHAIADEFNARGIAAGVVTGETPKDERARLYAGLAAGDLKVLSGVMVTTEGWDCLDSETEILTADGWRGMGEVAVGDMVHALNRETGLVESVPVTRYVERPMNPGERMFTARSQHVDIRTSEGHEFHVGTRWSRELKTVTGAELAERRTPYSLPLAADSAKPFPGVPLTDDELRFVAWFMTDGGFADYGVQIAQSKHYKDDIRALLTRLGFDFTERVRQPGRGSYPNGKPYHVFNIPKGTHSGSLRRNGWARLAEYLDKDVAPALHDMTREQFLVFWREALKGDGDRNWLTVDRRSQVDAYTMMASLRGLSSSYKTRTAPSGKDWYRVAVRDRQWLTSEPADPRSARLALEAPREDERVWCVTNEHSTLITRRNGKIAIIGNCPAVSCILQCRPTRLPGLYQQIVGRGLRLDPARPEKEDCLVLDVVGASRYQKLTTLVDLYESAEIDSTELDDVLPEEDEQLDEDEGAGLELPKPKLIGPKEYEDVNLFADSGYVWLFTYGGVRFLPAGDRIAVMWQHPKTGKLRVGHCLSKPRYDRATRQYDRDGVWLRDGWGSLDGWDLDTGRLALEAWVDNYAGTLAKKGASWRKGKSTPPTDAQIMMATRLGIDEPQLYSKAALSDEISIAFASQMLD